MTILVNDALNKIQLTSSVDKCRRLRCSRDLLVVYFSRTSSRTRFCVLRFGQQNSLPCGTGTRDGNNSLLEGFMLWKHNIGTMVDRMRMMRTDVIKRRGRENVQWCAVSKDSNKANGSAEDGGHDKIMLCC